MVKCASSGCENEIELYDIGALHCKSCSVQMGLWWVINPETRVARCIICWRDVYPSEWIACPDCLMDEFKPKMRKRLSGHKGVRDPKILAEVENPGVSEYLDKQTANSHYGAWDKEFQGMEFDDPKQQMRERPDLSFYNQELRSIFDVNCSDPNCNIVHSGQFMLEPYFLRWSKECYERHDWDRLFALHLITIAGQLGDWANQVQQDGQRRQEMEEAGISDNLPSMESSRDRFPKEEVALFYSFSGVLSRMLFPSTHGPHSGVFDGDPRRNDFLYAYYECMMRAHSFLDWGIYDKYAERIYKLLEEQKLYDIRYASITKTLCIRYQGAGQQELATKFSDISRKCCEELGISYTALRI